ncbi:MAG: thiamine-phosphate pyrophosphorylase [Epsilonproteobacteria bacterium]|nr:thiamine-phosphate pyrophosphorylase [Campylobacterota bacterium]NPA56731.1 thiamine-phosphate pyrophosphorylase [Campylobacterota bacterium]
MAAEESKLLRLVDANLNRLREGVRVVEDICRYIYDDEELALALKLVRHRVRLPDGRLLEARDVEGDRLRETVGSEGERVDLPSIITANMKRAQESARVLEEVLKLMDREEAEKFKAIRYELYSLERSLHMKRTSNSK